MNIEKMSRSVLGCILVLAGTLSGVAAEKGERSIGIWLSIMEHVDAGLMTADAQEKHGHLTYMKRNFDVDKTNWQTFGHIKAPMIALIPGQKGQLSIAGKPFETGKEPEDLSVQITCSEAEKGYDVRIAAARVKGADIFRGEVTIPVPVAANMTVPITLDEDANGDKQTLLYFIVFDGKHARKKMKEQPRDDVTGMIERFDFNGDGVVDAKEVSKAATEMADRLIERGLREPWSTFDADGNGIVSDKERAALQQELEKRLAANTTVATPKKTDGKPPVPEPKAAAPAPPTVVRKLNRIDKETIEMWAGKKGEKKEEKAEGGKLKPETWKKKGEGK